MAGDQDLHSNWARAVRGFDRNAYLLFATAGLLGFSYLGITTLLTNLFISRLGYSTSIVGNLNALFYLLHMAASVPAGAIGMRMGGRRSLILGGAIAVAGLALAPVAFFLTSPGTRLTILITSRLLASVGGALVIVNSGPALMGAVAPRDSTYAFAFSATTTSLTTFLGSICGGFLPGLFAALGHGGLASAEPYGMALWTAVLAVAPALLALLLFRETGRGASVTYESVQTRLPLALIALIAAVRFLRELGYGGIVTFFTLYLDTSLKLPTSSIGVLVSVASAASIVFTPLMPLIARRWGTGRTTLASLILMGLFALLMAASRHWGTAAAGWAGMTAANTVNEAAMQVYVLGIVTPHWRALMSGAANMATTLGLAVSASAGGYFIGTAGYAAMFAVSAALLFASSAAFAGHLFHRRFRAQDGVPSVAS